MLGQGNFGKVCVAYISRTTQIRDEDQVKNSEPVFQSPLKQGHKRHFSFKNNKYTVNQNYEPSGVNANISPDNSNSASIPLLPKDARKVAAKMAKGMSFFYQLSGLNYSYYI
jgi:hypothetical protein